MSADLMERLREVGELNDTWSAEQLAAAPTPPYPVDDLRPARPARRSIPLAVAAVLLVAVVAAAVVLAATNGVDPTEVQPADDPPPISIPMDGPDEPGGPDAPEPEDVETAGASAFCGVFNTMPEEVDGSFIGTDEHVAWFDELIEAAPEELLDDLMALRDHLDEHVDPSIPDSNLIRNYPPEVQASVTSLEAYTATTC